jgi:nucleoside-diphosphate-sugar epimerase
MKAVYGLDLRDIKDLRRVVHETNPTHVIHLAAISNVVHDDVSEIYETNIVGARNLLVSLGELSEKPISVLLMSSANIYGNSAGGKISESTQPNPANDYAVSKIGMEYMSRQFSDQLPIVIARPFNYTGRGQATSFLVPKMVSRFKEKADNIELGNIDVSRDFSDVRNVVTYMQRLIENPATIGGVYNICAGVPYSLKYIFETCKEITGHDMEIRINPAFIRQNEIKEMCGDPKKLRQAVGAVKAHSMRETLQWMLND